MSTELTQLQFAIDIDDQSPTLNRSELIRLLSANTQLAYFASI